MNSQRTSTVFTGKASYMNVAIMVTQIEALCILKDNLVSISLQGSVLMSPLQTQLSMVCHEGIQYKGTLARNPQCSRSQRIDEAGIGTLPAVDQGDYNCLEEALQSFIVMRSRCRSTSADVIFRRPLPVFPVVPCSSVHCLQTRITVELFLGTQAPIAQ
ncbi:uncharacterized protein TNCV_3156771 [Trichonephila clavipes]|nr:uncharacterized protein TNCV_3156771 [Trichonephila clavipes]